MTATGCGRRAFARAPDATTGAFADPRDPEVNRRAPERFGVRLETSTGTVLIAVVRAWAPIGADRFFNLVQSGFYDGQRISRVRPGFIAQWGLHMQPAVIAAWKNAFIADDPNRQTNAKGTIAFAFKDPNTRATQVYINLADNTQLDAQGFAPFGRVTAGMDAVERWYGGYGETAGGGLRAGTQGPIEAEGAAWLDRNYPRLDRIITARIVP
ncbi:MAG: peptidylprolyl isomerase [Gemmatimonadetes bacterium]|nr:peptidylprolyl isomerase [Gemmatimonadota bacterium]